MATPKVNPNYYAVIPASVRYDNSLPALARLLYAEVSALSNQAGFCWASNSYFAGLFEVKPKRISELIGLLESAGHIRSEIITTSGNVRNIYLSEAIPKNKDRYPEKKGDPILKNKEHNNKLNTKKNIEGAETTNDHDSKDILEAYQLYLKCFKMTDAIKESANNWDEAVAMAAKRYRLTPKRRDAIKRRLDDAGLNMLKAAIIGYSNEEWYLGVNDRGWTADLEEFICRSYENVEKGANKFESQKQAKNTNDPWKQ